MKEIKLVIYSFESHYFVAMMSKKHLRSQARKIVSNIYHKMSDESLVHPSDNPRIISGSQILQGTTITLYTL